MYTYYLETGFTVRDRDGKIVAPCQDPTDPDFCAYNMWATEGNTPATIDRPAPIVMTVTPRQIRQALTRANLRDTVEYAVAHSTSDVKDSWEFSTEINRYDPLLLNLAAGLGLTDEQINNLFNLAKTL